MHILVLLLLFTIIISSLIIVVVVLLPLTVSPGGKCYKRAFVNGAGGGGRFGELC